MPPWRAVRRRLSPTPITEAERNRAEDSRVREHIEARNALDAVAYQVERRLTDLGDRTPVHEKARAEMLVADARQAIKDDAPTDRLRSLASELQQVYHGLGTSGFGGQPGGPGGPGGGPRGPGGPSAPPGGSSGDDVIDAEFTTE